MTWKHVALVGLAIALVLLCGLSNVCSSNPGTFAGVLQLAGTIIGVAGGHATSRAAADAPHPPQKGVTP